MNVDGEKLSQAIALLRDDHLIWSQDFDAIREPLKKLLLALITLGSSGAANYPVQLEVTQLALQHLLDALVDCEG